MVFRRPVHRKKNGQMLVAVMLMVTTVIIMFGMTVSVGHLVQSKINLQNSVDLASMSAASYQARHLNALSIANYRIRAVLKFFLLDSYVTQGRFNQPFINDVANPASGSGLIPDPVRYLSVCEQARNFSPSLRNEGGQGVDDTTNVCYNFGGAPRIITPLIASPFPGFSPIYIFINQTLLAIAAQFQQSCTDWSGQNGAWANYAITRAANDTDAQYSQRTKILGDLLQPQPQSFAYDLGGEAVPVGEAGESARATFYSNLIGSLKETELPVNRLLYLNNNEDRMVVEADLIVSRKSMGLSYVEPVWRNGCSIQVNQGGATANRQSMVQGFSKDPDKILTVPFLANGVNPKILFWPIGIEPTLVAVAAAKPFGSRVGPPPRYFQQEGGPSGYGNVALFPGDDASALNRGGLGHKDILRYALGTFPSASSGVPVRRPTNELAQTAYAPSIFDGMYYSIFPPTSEYFPADVLPSLTINSQLTDRRSSLPNPYAWSTPSLPNYYNAASITSAWAPPGDARSGYQIKLVGFTELCNTAPVATPKLQQLCTYIRSSGTL